MNKIMEERIKVVMSSVFNVPKGEILSDSSTNTINSWDSLRHMDLIIGLEEEFDIEFDDENIGNLLNYDLIKKHIKELML